MATQEKDTKTVEDKIKLYLAPLLVTVFGAFFMADIREVKSDVKILLFHDNAQIEQIKNMDKEIDDLRGRIQELEKIANRLDASRHTTNTTTVLYGIKPKILVKTANGFKYES